MTVLYYRTRENMVLIRMPVEHLDQRVDRVIHAGPVAVEHGIPAMGEEGSSAPPSWRCRWRR
jgi:hypothetical protein